jgi:hypothetical protein
VCAHSLCCSPHGSASAGVPDGISGTFATDYNDFHVRQQGTALVGCYEYDFGALDGTIEGHTDSTGSAEHNRVVSQQRADAVKAYLVTAGIDAERLQTMGFGASQPVADNSTELGRSQNRRVELVRDERRAADRLPRAARDAEKPASPSSAGELPRQRRVALVDTLADLVALDPLEVRGESGLILLTEDPVGHRVEDVVLLVDVLAQQRNVGGEALDDHRPRGRIAGGCSRDVVGDRRDVGTAELVLVKHHCDRTGLEGKPPLAHADEQQILLLGVVAMVGEVADEIDERGESLGIGGGAAGDRARLPFGGLEDHQDQLVLMPQDVGRKHGDLPSLQ